jgi:Lrp/AsnC family leucine-responsive transcriptional regulator
MSDLLVGALRTLPGVTRTHTTIVLRSIKEDTRVHVSPALLERRSR